MEQEIILYFKFKKAGKECGKPHTWYAPWRRRQWRKRIDVKTGSLSCQGSLAAVRTAVYSLPPLPAGESMNDRIRKGVRRQINKIVLSYGAPYALIFAEELEERLHVHTEVDDRFLAGMVQAVMYDSRKVEEALLIEGEEDPLPILETIYRTLNRLIILTQQPSRYDAFAEDVWEDTGLVAACRNTAAGWISMKGTPLVIDMHADMQLSCRQIPRGAVYVDLCPGEQKRRFVQLKRSDVRYVDFGKFLDSY